MDVDFLSDEAMNLIRKYTPELIGIGAGAGILGAVRSFAITESSGKGTDALIDFGLFAGSAWAASQWSTGVMGRFSHGVLLSGSLALLNDGWTMVMPESQGLTAYIKDIFAGTAEAAVPTE